MTSRKRSPHDFIFKEELGHGSYSTVFKALDKKSPNKIYAIKVCSKKHIIKEAKVKYVTIEKNTMNLLAQKHHAGIIKLYYTFHDEENLYFVLDFAPGGELLSLLHKMGTFNDIWTRHFTAQLIDALEFIHSHGIIHRDLKPENVLLDRDGRLMITDFGAAATIDPSLSGDSAKFNSDSNGSKDNQNCASFVGTAEYVSPELLLYNQCGYGSDIWALGCMIYQFVQGQPPFRGENELKTFEKIVALDYPWGPNNRINNSTSPINPLVINLVQKILVIEVNERISLEQIKRHPYFSKVDWNDKIKIWRGIWQSQGQSLQQTTLGLPNTPQNILPTRQLHVIDTPARSIQITKQKRKKPTKISNTTSSIVVWRKRLGISTGKDDLGTVPSTTPAVTAPNDTNVLTNTAAHSTANIALPPNSQSNQVKRAQLVAPNRIPPKVPVINDNVRNKSIPRTKPNVPPLQTSSIPQKLSTSSASSALSAPSTEIRNQDLTHTLDGRNSIDIHVLKQDYVFIYGIPYEHEGPAMSLNSYNKIDNDLITSLVAQHKEELKNSESFLQVLTLKKSGMLSYKNTVMEGNDDQENKEHQMANIEDTDLSMYDFEFNELTRKGFLILEKYKNRIWFISLPSYSTLSKIPFNAVKSSTINNNENWVDCFFRARQLLEEKQILDKISNVSFDSKASSEPSSPPPISRKERPLSIGNNVTTLSYTAKNGSQNNAPQNDNVGEEKPFRIPSSTKDRPGANSTPSSRHPRVLSSNNAGETPKKMNGRLPNSAPSTNTYTNGSVPAFNHRPSTNVGNNKHNILTSKKQGSSVFSPSSSTTKPQIKTTGYRQPTPSPPLPQMEFPTTREKYSAPSNMVISSSRYEVLHTLNNSQTNFDREIASRGASAAFRSLQKSKKKK
ncbi:ANL_collapsed_G0012970.mRNA.1.CDS.1 [Saccharomyces cerevisiae]|nr:ANL_HP_G0000870.mRNA.1.CDS.1 [Saccharomyces cerevisiae]CAI5034884.1 AVN_HP_G0074170.mRNA.1.CDS.1 [Saccharomyces cerevisiae]CAI5055555.1 ANL_HP_G0090920.mRNA.1.CDS.1 [Saccharomyces cerevisiae]CAI5205939.1 ANL_HP_G0149940.mRNA.1.CDS.1 [Saccharomyces cerevisiae]CAI6585388.1 ANL_collapsed_G0012970.mRNA.1.CDS.1 [Saccharomyces cerevisiae]